MNLLRNECEFSPCRAYRYTLRHTWNQTQKSIMVVGLNPSTADEDHLDPTLRRVKSFAQGWGYGGFVMTNLFAYRSTDPKMLVKAHDPIGPDNLYWIKEILMQADEVLCAWGGGIPQAFTGHAKTVLEHLVRYGEKVVCMGLTKHGNPKHPLYLSANSQRIPIRGG